MRLPSIMSHPRARVSALCGVAFLGAASQAWAQSPGAGTAAQPPYSIIFVISDQEADHLLVTGNDYELPARAEIRRRGIDFRNHYTASAMCTPSRAAFFSGQPPQVPHDIMYADANIPGKPVVQKALTDSLLTPPPNDTIYQKTWTLASPPGLQESLTAPGMPQALAEYQKGWSGSFGYIPTVRPDMWSYFYNYYLNLIRDNDQVFSSS
jgi:hypothetical protein